MQSFSKDGYLISEIVPQGDLISTLYFCIDKSLNIIISDKGANGIKVFSRDGN